MKFELITPTENDDLYYYYLLSQNEKVASLSFKPVLNGEDDIFQNLINDDEFDEIFFNSSYLYLNKLHVNNQKRGKGYANKILTNFFQLYEKTFITIYPQIVLNASPMDLDISLSVLIKFYEKFNFINFYITDTNSIMVRDSFML